MTLLKILEYHYIKLLENSILELKKRLAYIIVIWWQPLAINISSTKEQGIHLHNQHLAQKQP